MLVRGHEIVRQQGAEYVGELGFGAAVLADEEAFEDGLVEPSPNLMRGVLVGLVAVGEEGEAAMERRFDRCELDLGVLEELLGRFEFLGDPVLLGLEEVECDGSGVVSFEEFAALLSEVPDAAGSDGVVTLCFGAAGRDLLVEQLREERRIVGINADVPPLLLDVSLDEVYRDRLLCAVGAFLISAETEEVKVGSAVPIGGLGDAQTAAAGCAPDRALQVVVMDALLLAGHVVRGEDFLDALEDVLLNELWMCAVVRRSVSTVSTSVSRIFRRNACESA